MLQFSTQHHKWLCHQRKQGEREKERKKRNKKAWIFPHLGFRCCLQLLVNSFYHFSPPPPTPERVGTTRGKARLCHVVYKRWRRGIQNNRTGGAAALTEGCGRKTKWRRKEMEGLVYLHSSLRPERRRCESSSGIFRAELTMKMWDLFFFFESLFLASNLSSEAGAPTASSRPASSPLHRVFFFFLEIDRQGLRDSSLGTQTLGSSRKNRKGAIDFPFAELATILLPFCSIFCLSLMAFWGFIR